MRVLIIGSKNINCMSIVQKYAQSQSYKNENIFHILGISISLEREIFIGIIQKYAKCYGGNAVRVMRADPET